MTQIIQPEQPRPHAPVCQRGWMPYRVAASDYLGIAPSVLLEAIRAGRLVAYEKPLTRGRNADATREYHSYFVNLDDVDAWIRTYWTPAYQS